MLGLAIRKDVDARIKSGHDEMGEMREFSLVGTY